ncbi:DUF192 domain-containing protein [Niallia sp. Krafla_26]|uniref:DUF192 domain-containing protein n=1 Tax=Niallia sp. Krafla_26 TaxID=3064703 RepID=UPI003D17F3A6
MKNIPIKVYQFNTFFKRLKGLMFRIRPIVEEGILLTPCNSIHMFFMFFPIDVVFLNEQYEIVSLHKNVKPWRVILPIKNAKSALELPLGTITNYSLQIGDTINIKQ